jgi:hypothetical protein
MRISASHDVRETSGEQLMVRTIEREFDNHSKIEVKSNYWQGVKVC